MNNPNNSVERLEDWILSGKNAEEANQLFDEMMKLTEAIPDHIVEQYEQTRTLDLLKKYDQSI